ncbi:uncharacterized protein LOC133837195 [Drosophila sulfurigaster albostrigata]|uniref:uncharacterized protein LOC133837195 n=1 Tax=Drosophila sulfurigaster albostrigata TaxID=89887 RepID=UPI002D21C15F|nr:uncharacterized protein LOC133837195 [Drosophila sulfurigaster albostrigata]
MCWCARVYWTVLQNLFARFYNSLTEQQCDYVCCGCGCCCCGDYRDVDADSEAGERVSASIVDDDQQLRTQHDYVIVDDADANYAEIECRQIETEAYYFTVDRATAEHMLEGREDGACLVRPFKATDVCIKYIVSIYAGEQYYHLFVRQIDGRQRYGIGQLKPHERHFPSPCDIIEFYAEHALLCTNKQRSQSIRLKPISYA